MSPSSAGDLPENALIIETPEHVELHFALASLGNRFLACAIDHALQLLAIAIVIITALSLNRELRALSEKALDNAVDKASEGHLWVVAVLTLVIFVIYFGYFTLFETLWSGQTPGKRLLKLRVIQEDGRPINAFAALSRNLLRGADMMPMLGVPLYSVGICAVFANARAKRLGDFVAGTVVIKERQGEAPSFAEVFESDELTEGRLFDIARRRIAPPVNFVGDVRALTPTEIEVVETFLRRRYDLPEHPRQWMAWRVAFPVLEKLRPQYDVTTFNYEGFLEELLARYYKR